EGGDASGFEEDARLTAMWLWTVRTARDQDDLDSSVTAALNPEAPEDEGEDAATRKAEARRGIVLEAAVAFRIAQGLGARLEAMPHVVEVKGELARLLPVSERTRYLLGVDGAQAAGRERSDAQGSLFRGSDEVAVVPVVRDSPTHRLTTLDRLHQAMLLFGEA